MALPLTVSYCVTGALRQEIIEATEGTDLRYIHNSNHHKGMGTSLSTAISHIIDSNDIELPDAVLVMLTDQPLIPVSHYRRLIDTAISNKADIISTSYNETYGAPTLFKKATYKDLQRLNETVGAKSVITKYKNRTQFIECTEAGFDVDTDEDYVRLVKV